MRIHFSLTLKPYLKRMSDRKTLNIYIYTSSIWYPNTAGKDCVATGSQKSFLCLHQYIMMWGISWITIGGPFKSKSLVRIWERKTYRKNESAWVCMKVERVCVSHECRWHFFSLALNVRSFVRPSVRPYVRLSIHDYQIRVTRQIPQSMHTVP